MAWQRADGDRRCVHKKSDGSGDRCSLWGVKGTEPPTCQVHGGSAKQVRAAAKRRIEAKKVQELAEQLDIEVPEFSTAAEAARYLVNRTTKRAAQFGHLADQLGAGLIYADQLGIERIKAAVAGESAWLNNLAKVLAIATAAEARQDTDSQFRSQVMDDVLWAAKTALSSILVKHHLDVGGLTDEWIAEFQRVIAWAVSTGGDKSAKYDPEWDDEPKAITAGG